jgi:hypothetical protein
MDGIFFPGLDGEKQGEEMSEKLFFFCSLRDKTAKQTSRIFITWD